MSKRICECCGKAGTVYKIKGRSACLDCIDEFSIDVVGWEKADG